MEETFANIFQSKTKNHEISLNVLPMLAMVTCTSVREFKFLIYTMQWTF